MHDGAADAAAGTGDEGDGGEEFRGAGFFHGQGASESFRPEARRGSHGRASGAGEKQSGHDTTARSNQKPFRGSVRLSSRTLASVARIPVRRKHANDRNKACAVLQDCVSMARQSPEFFRPRVNL
jgi:hypothetical protein